MKTKIWIAMLTIYIVWGSTYLAIRFAVETIPPFFQAGIRFLVAGVILLVWQRVRGAAMPTRQQWRSLFIIGTFLLMGGTGLIAWAEQFLQSSITALVIAASPLFMTIAESLRPGGTKPGIRTVMGIALGFLGIFILINPSGSFAAETQLDLSAVLAILCSCALWSIGSAYSKHVELPKSIFVTSGAEMLAGSFCLLVVSVLSGELSEWQTAAVSMRSLVGVAYLIVAGSLIGFVVYGWLLQNAPMSLISTYAYINPIVAVILGRLFADEDVGPHVLLAAFVIISSVVFINRAQSPTIIKRGAEATEH